MSADIDAKGGSLRWKHVIGILGGMGPYAHIELEKQLLQATAELIGRPPVDQDYPSWLLASFPETPDRTLALLGRGPSPLPWLERGVRSITAGQPGLRAEFVVIACITAHAYLEQLQRRVAVPVVDTIVETVRRAADLGARRVGVLATTGALQARVYQDAAERLADGMEIVSLLDLEHGGRSGVDLQELLLMEPVYGPWTSSGRAGGGLKSGLVEDPAGEISGRVAEGVRLLKEARAELVVLGCTELPMVIRDQAHGIPLLDPLAIVARSAVEMASGIRPLP
ncbi:MAG: aspartate/glutamate racemase family protein [Chloroflexi bacterium]|nr:aspartate/glutamate racemase family protein [Chloroflexota bacterium]